MKLPNKLVLIAGAIAIVSMEAALYLTVQNVQTQLQRSKQGNPTLELRIEEEKFSEGAYNFLAENFKAEGLLNTGAPFFDLRDSRIKEIYEGVNANADTYAKPRWGLRESQSTYEIENIIRNYLRHDKKALVVIAGEGTDIWGAIDALRMDSGIAYVPVTPNRANLDNILASRPFQNSFGARPEREKIDLGMELVRDELIRDLGIARYLGQYPRLEDLMNKLSGYGSGNAIVVGIERPHIPGLSGNKEEKSIYELLIKFLEAYNPNSVLYIASNFGNRPLEDFSEEPIYREQFFQAAQKMGKPVEVASFGSPNDRGFNPLPADLPPPEKRLFY